MARGNDGDMNQPPSPAAQTDQTPPQRKHASARWRKLLEDQRASGLPISAFCRERGIPASSLFAWRRRLTGGGGEPMFAPVKIAATSTPARPGRGDGDGDDDGGAGAIELYLPGARRLIVRRGFDRRLLADVVHALESLA
jgi:hypothetical protein